MEVVKICHYPNFGLLPFDPSPNGISPIGCSPISPIGGSPNGGGPCIWLCLVLLGSNLLCLALPEDNLAHRTIWHRNVKEDNLAPHDWTGLST